MKDALILQDKKYISAKRAAVIFGYSSDYVGQLCREGKIECTMVGRSWFVSEESVLKHKVASSDARVASEDSVKIVSVPVPVQQSTPAISSSTTESFLGSSKSIKDFISDEQTQFSKPISYQSPNVTKDIITEKSDDAVVVPKVSVPSPIQLDTTSDVEHKITKSPIVSKKKNNKFDLSLVIILLLLSAVLFSKNFISYFPYSSKDIVATVLNGVVVAPSSTSSLEDESIKNDLRNPFSDEVTIKPDSSGTSGVIVPVFKESKGDDFLYVMVPVKDSKKDENK